MDRVFIEDLRIETIIGTTLNQSDSGGIEGSLCGLVGSYFYVV